MLKPLNERVIIQVQEEEEKTASGIVLPSAAKEKPQVGQVVAVADATDDYTPQVKVGDQVIFEKYAVSEIRYEGDDYLIIKEKDLTAVVE
ncbi:MULTISPECIES: co-chaperone GroES [Aerococcus]|uniref:co-chaperone GroES n=1 Tax=Aerococcus TaxID=1375 RepID=UPI000DCD5229|nr:MULTISPECIES: co-chaperone GroES [Aerococcus]MDK8133104.1 co-chaperone GroES [Aerococcus urinae]MDK8485356.1 co-chaperone GroES [Aerococcus urinae]MDL5177885.1 co-chaperone GroES [Aerococcus tenax]RAV91903.1 co-chaperone GroES [Aerococcus tenax]